MESSESEIELTASDIAQAAEIADSNLIPEVSKEKYLTAYNMFMKWCKKQKADSYSENVLLAYFGELATKFKATTLWTVYSMLRATLNISNNLDISKYERLRIFLKKNSDGYKPKKSKMFSTEEINDFLRNAPDSKYLLTKVVLIMGVTGACRRDELYKMKITDVKDLGSAVLVEIPNTKSKVSRKFTITGHYYEVFKRYLDLRPPNINEPWFFLNYQKGKCSAQKLGINKFGNLGKQIASYLKLPNPELYTSHCFRRSARVRIFGENVHSFIKHEEVNVPVIKQEYLDENNEDHMEMQLVEGTANLNEPESLSEDGEKYSEPEEPFGYYMNSHHLLDQLSPKEHYYKRKLELLEKKLSLYERGVEAQERIANALERYCSNINKSQ